MDEGKNPQPRIYSVKEIPEFKEDLASFIEQISSENGTVDLISKMTTLMSSLDQSAASSKMLEASIQLNDAHWEYYQILKKNSFDRKHKEAMERRRLFAQKHLMESLTSNAEDELIVGMSGSRMPWNCGD